MKRKWYTVNDEGNFYDNMTGKLVRETPITKILEFKLEQKMGGIQRVQFWKRNLIFNGEYYE